MPNYTKQIFVMLGVGLLYTLELLFGSKKENLAALMEWYHAWVEKQTKPYWEAIAKAPKAAMVKY